MFTGEIMQSTETGRPVTPQIVNIIRLALLSGSLLFGLVVFFVRNQEPAPESAAEMGVLVYVFLGLAIVAVSVAAMMKNRQAGADTLAARFSLAIAGWGVCESTALFGGVYYLLTGVPYLYIIGLLLFASSLLFLSPMRME
jgi:hypothetical protein